MIGGVGAFVGTAADYDDFASTVVAKLVREIAGAPIARARSGRRRVAGR